MALEDGFEPPTRTPSTCRSTSELLQRLDPTPGIEPGRGSSADRRLPTWPGRAALAPGEGLEPPSRGSEPHVLPVRPPWCEVWRPRRGSNPPPTARQAVVPSRGLRGRDEESVVVVRRGGFAPPQPLATGLRPAGLACARAGARSTTPVMFGLPCLFGFQSAGPGSSGQKEKGPGVARPLLSAPCLIVRVPVAPTEETPGPMTLEWAPAHGHMSWPAVPARAGLRSRKFGCGFPIRRCSAYGIHGKVRIYRVVTHCQAANLTIQRIDALPTRQLCLNARAKHRFDEPCRACHRAGRGKA